MKKYALAAIAAVTALWMSLNAFAAADNKTGIIVDGKYVTSFGTGSKTGPGSVNAETEEILNDLPGDAVTAVGNLELDKLNVPDNADTLITLAGTVNSDTGTLCLLTKNKTSDGRSYWIKTLECMAKYGKAGLGKTVEGDNKTPIGVFILNTPFGNKAAEEGFPVNYKQVDSTYYWNGDSGSGLYNKLVSTGTYTDFSKSASEHIVNYGAYYNYCIDTGYNYEGTPHRGSAIFIHCMVNNENTHGCIAVDEENMKTIMRAYTEGSSYIAIYDAADVGKVYK